MRQNVIGEVHGVPRERLQAKLIAATTFPLRSRSGTATEMILGSISSMANA